MDRGADSFGSEPEEDTAATPAPAIPAAVAEHAGLKLYLSAKASSGYKGVSKEGKRYKAQVTHGSERGTYLGAFDTALEAVPPDSEAEA